MELKNIIINLSLGCFCAGVGIGKFIITGRIKDVDDVVNPKDTAFSPIEKFAIVASLFFFLFALVFFIYGMYLWHY